LKQVLEKYTKDQIRRAAQIKAIFFEAVGVFTDNKIIYDESGKEVVHFSTKDGHIVRYLKKAGILIGIISARDSSVVNRRCNELGLDFCHQGILDKSSVFEKLIKHYKLKAKEVAFIGNDIDDLPLLRSAGFSACPSDAVEYLKSQVLLVTTARGGRGVVREVADLVLAARGDLDKMLK
jgi:3-deoxy-D-manno-octulosonate 8-phosphate phosphatase (KDO 8-P phosphatase)